MILLKEVLCKFLSEESFLRFYSSKRFTQQTVKNLLAQFEKNYRDSTLYEEGLQYTIKETVLAYTSNKMNAIRIFKIFLKFLKEEYDVDCFVPFPSIDISNSFERQMYIAKTLQDQDKTVDDIVEELWVSQRTIEDDLGRLRGFIDPIKVCGRPFIIKETKRRDGRLFFPSTVHPLFLTFNLTQVLCTLKGLQQMSEDKAYKEYALISARSIWCQLSDYAKERIMKVLIELFTDDVEWYKSLEYSTEKMFYTEYDCSSNTEGLGVILDCLKNRKRCFIEYQIEDNRTTFLKNCLVLGVSYREGTISLACNEHLKIISRSKILRSAYTMEDLL